MKFHNTLYGTFQVQDEEGQPSINRFPITLGSLSIQAGMACCGTKEVKAFYFRPRLTHKRKQEIAKFLVENTMKLIEKDKEYSYLNAFFLKVGKERQFKHHQIMQAMLDYGWKKVGEPFINRRYGTEERQHYLQPLIYIIQPNKKGNFYE